MITGFLHIPWFAWAGFALIVALVFVYIWPHKAITARTGFRFFVIRWGHSMTWVLLAVNFLLRGSSSNLSGAANLIAAAGGFIYLLFMLMTFVVK